jgi:hypothetical protein
MKWQDMKPERKEPPTNTQKWAAQKFSGIDADYIPGFDDGETPREALEAISPAAHLRQQAEEIEQDERDYPILQGIIGKLNS